jgi:hypothetical protein
MVIVIEKFRDIGFLEIQLKAPQNYLSPKTVKNAQYLAVDLHLLLCTSTHFLNACDKLTKDLSLNSQTSRWTTARYQKIF